ncbi:MAG: amidohydrolase family protein [Armatimonadetes bacterium]|nr:amidohydrolase family protein [Armatimonadota bacterium]
MSVSLIVADSCFDGERHRPEQTTIVIRDGRIGEVVAGDLAAQNGATPAELRQADVEVVRTPFAMPGLVEGHCHLFLDGDETDQALRSAHLKQPFEGLLETAWRSLELNVAAGITAIRDAGDVHGVNTRIKAELTAQPGRTPEMRSAGFAIRKAKRYGSFLAREVQGLDDLPQVIRDVAPTADYLKIMLSGIIDFESGTVKGAPQFDVEEAKLIQATAEELGLQTSSHISGLDGLTIAAEAGINSIEHGFFMNREILAVMRDKQIAWIPTFMPVDFQWRYPEYCGWNEATVGELRKILDNHDEHLVAAYEMGVPVICGSDAGSYGSPHGRALIEDLVLMRRAGAPMEAILRSATSLPRATWGLPRADLAVGCEANVLCLAGSPFDAVEHVRSPQAVYHHGWRQLGHGTPGAAVAESRAALLVRN